MTKPIPITFRTFSPFGESGPRGAEREALIGLLATSPVVGGSKHESGRDWFSFSRLSFASSLAWHDGQAGIV